MKLVQLCGSNNVGKTTAMKYFVAKILKEQPATVLYRYKDLTAEEILNSIDNKSKKGRIRCDFTIVIEIEGMIIGITTFGDQTAILQEKFKVFVKYDCDICFCASHPYQKMQDYLTEFVRNEKDLITVDKKAVADLTLYEKENRVTAEVLYDRLQKLIAE